MSREPLNIVGPQVRRLRWELGFSQPALAGKCQLRGWDVSRVTTASAWRGMCIFCAGALWGRHGSAVFQMLRNRPPNHKTRQQSAVTLRAAFLPPLICCACSASWESGEASRSAGLLVRSFGASLGRLVQRRVLFALSLHCSANRSGLMPRRIDLGDVARFSPLFAPTPFSRGRVLLSAQ